jgi:hypothetical protein
MGVCAEGRSTRDIPLWGEQGLGQGAGLDVGWTWGLHLQQH